MGWVRIDDAFYDHPAHAGLDLAAWGLWTWSLAWSNRNLTDGRIPKAAARRMDPDGIASGALIAAGRWVEDDDAFVVHDFLEFQPSAEQVRKRREKERDRWARRSGPDSGDPPRGAGAERPRTPRASQPQPHEEPNPVVGDADPVLALVVVTDPRPDPVDQVFEAWTVSTGRTRSVLTPKRRRLIDAALKLYPLDDVIAAVRGWRHSRHHRGENDRSTVYNDLELLLRDAAQIEKFRDLEQGSTGPKPERAAGTALGRGVDAPRQWELDADGTAVAAARREAQA